MELLQLTNLIKEKLTSINYELVNLSIKKEKGDSVLSIIVDRVEPIDMEAIVEVSNVLNAYLDELDPFDNPYTLDVSSLGAEKPLKIEELGAYVNRYVHIHLINPIEGENIYEGNLDSVNEDSIKLSYKIKTRNKVVDIKKENISKARLAIKF
ncbi:MAG: ribosome maturation factor RimP [Bacilli bacterium]|nr:ribosome maturation factor RimP [Bacilli bacterium]